MYNPDTIAQMHSSPGTTAKAVVDHFHIFALGDGKFALGNRGEKAAYVVRRILNRTDSLGRGLPTYKGVQARRPRIPNDARIVRREDAGRLMLRAFGLR